MTSDSGEGWSKAESAPPLWRRMAAFVYEGVLLFGVVVIAGYLYSSLTQQRHAMQGVHGLQVYLFLVLGLYFFWFWSHGGQTVAMKTWHIRIVSARGGRVSIQQAIVRYLLCWTWFLPALGILWYTGASSGAQITLVTLLGVILYAALAHLRPDKQFMHDALAGTRLLDTRPELARPLAIGEDLALNPTNPTRKVKS